MQKEIKNIFSKLLPFVEIRKEIIHGSRQVSLYGDKYSITRWDDGKYQTALREITRIYPKNGVEFVEYWFSSALMGILLDPGSFEQALGDMHSNLVGAIKKRFICIPVQGIDFRSDEIDFGFGSLLHREHGTLAEIIDKEEYRQSWQHNINALAECPCYFQIETETDHENAINEAIFFSTYLTSLLSLFVGSSQYRANPPLLPWHKRTGRASSLRKRKIAIYGSEAGDSQVYYSYCVNGTPREGKDYSLEFNLLTSGHDSNDSINASLALLRPEQGKASYHLIDPELIEKIFSIENSKLLSCVSRKEALDKKLFNAVSWFGKAVNSDSIEDQFLFFTIAIESLLVGDESEGKFSSQGSITQKISERTAYLIGTTFDERLETEIETKKLYGIRSKIVHTGARAATEDVIRIENLCRNLIFGFSTKNFASQDAYLKWIKTNQYGNGR